MTQRWQRLFSVALVVVALASTQAAAAAVKIDGVFAADEWSGAQKFDRFVSVQPLTGKPAPDDRRAEAYLLSTPEGIAVAMRVWHPAGVAKTRNRMQRDAHESVDRVNFMLDLDADGRAGYDFTITAAGDLMDGVISNENSFNNDWDGAWQHAVADSDDGYVAEWLIPWTIAQMRDSSAPRRSIGVYFAAIIGATGERYAYPEASFTRPRFVSDFARVEIDQYQQAQLAITPYAVARHDQITGENTFKTGADLFWKPSGDHQFALTVNPDFGQVESDDLVVDFSNVEVYFTDKRPFFTENQSYFELQHNLGTLFYTRRVGARADIDAAVKGNGSIGKFGYGVFAAQEDGAAGGEFALLRSSYDLGTLDLGLSRSRVERALADREANVTELDARWQPNERWLLRPLLMHSDSLTSGSARNGNAAGLVIDWDMPGPWRQQYFAHYADRDFELNDLGYQSRNDFRVLEWESGYRQDNLSADSRFASHDWEFELVSSENTADLLLRRSLTVSRYSELRDGGNLTAFVRGRAPAWDDRLSRGHGAVPLQGGAQLYLGRNRPRRGDDRLAWSWDVNVFPNAVAGNTLILGVQPRWFINDHFDVNLGLYRSWQSDWLVWQDPRNFGGDGREFGSFRRNEVGLISNLNWFLSDKQELRIKLQAIAIDATAQQARRLDADGKLIDSSAALADFQVRNLGFQIRYRYKLAELSDVYAVYSRGGFAQDADETGMSSPGLNDSLVDAFALRDADQVMVKLAYRFDL